MFLPSPSTLRRLFYNFILLISIIQCINCYNFQLDANKKHYSQCDRCQLVVESFKNGLRQTLRGKHEGGDAHWEENRLVNYPNSEIRLIDIQEQLCNELSSGKDHCHSFAEEHESVLESWFFSERKKDKDEGSSLFEYLCSVQLSVCCPAGHYGPECLPCPGHPNEICNDRGFCQGNQTREGTGKCVCHKQYSGDTCEQCADGHFSNENITTKTGDVLPRECKSCDRSCSSCHSRGPRGCLVCRAGYLMDHESGCIDIDECRAAEVNPCTDGQYCINTHGSFNCYQCHTACLNCSGPGIDACLECQADHVKIHGTCVSKEEQLSRHLPYYLAYLCLCVVTYFVSLKSMTLGCMLGLTFGVYIVLYEFEFVL